MGPDILTVTVNPSLDRTVQVPALRLGQVNRAGEHHVEPSGKGVNVSRALLVNGHPSRAILPIGGAEGAQLRAMLSAEGVDFVGVPIAASIRVNISVISATTGVTKINEVGPVLTEDELAALTATTIVQARGARWVVACGSLPPGVPDDLYARLCRDVHEVGTAFALDASGTPLIKGLTGEPDLIKPNLEELAEAAAMPLRTLDDVVRAARSVCRDRTTALVSLGPDGALLLEPGRDPVHAEAGGETPRSTVGAGDNLLAGFLSRPGGGVDALREAVAWGSAAVRVHGSRAAAVTDADRRGVRVHATIEPARVLRHGDRDG